MIVNALRKFESAGVIESRSSGMKGTYIKVINDVIFDELDEIRKQKKKASDEKHLPGKPVGLLFCCAIVNAAMPGLPGYKKIIKYKKLRK